MQPRPKQFRERRLESGRVACAGLAVRNHPWPVFLVQEAPQIQYLQVTIESHRRQFALFQHTIGEAKNQGEKGITTAIPIIYVYFEADMLRANRPRYHTVCATVLHYRYTPICWCIDGYRCSVKKLDVRKSVVSRRFARNSGVVGMMLSYQVAFIGLLLYTLF